ncbi:F-box domain containing protein [Pyrenophora tritici-repentis]|uniref:F-box domain containing protein n=2 Tax=Pyrenophora tritici-repentis TaxID=45151 RepID=A0A2W1FD91_9PLEO|nr:uncharacterized protein PTRG_09634 [Pyrenophora tritici-repentis Pt-1C-BFP]KAA8617816.1 F-box domain-containing protein [Pyrenophora tritici-repentis]EDU42685.1 predicted protein [Pyrenophora tritici-repentis Pt-1C-BFP]KAF7443233.1 F-box domain containing protein [Pyrenophora tritici-repentis]KAF7568290.1 F-box domain containing protein [Pyrenophora tritici-repentis]KAG9377077.1 F-box domain containing protein [Pyrenophora tritici-repentis]
MDFVRLQQETFEHLREGIVDEDALETRYPLDYGNQDFTLSLEYDVSLGALDALPIELQQKVLSFLDIKALLVFRRVSKPALSLVNTLLEYQKIVMNAPMALRMSIAIGMHENYTISQLFDALCERGCADCGTLAHYICLFTCSRLCLSQNGCCPGKLAPRILLDLPVQDDDGSIQSDMQVENAPDNWVPEHVPRFTPVPGTYFVSRPLCKYGSTHTLTKIRPGNVFIDMNAFDNGKKFVSQYIDSEDQVMNVLYKTISVVVAPWLSKTSMSFECGMQCPGCMEEDREAISNLSVLQTSITPNLDTRVCEIWTKEGLVEHARRAHGGNDGSQNGHMEL